MRTANVPKRKKGSRKGGFNYKQSLKNRKRRIRRKRRRKMFRFKNK